MSDRNTILDDRTLQEIVQRTFGHQTPPRSVMPIGGGTGGDTGGGTINEVFWIEGQGIPPAILRIAPSASIAAAGPGWLTSFGLRREQAAISLLSELGPILPRTIHFDTSRDLIDRDWIVQSVVPGQAWVDLDATMTDVQRLDLWRQAGTLCRKIHAVQADAFGPLGGRQFAHWSDLLAADAEGFINDACRFDLDIGQLERLRGAVRAHRANLDQVTSPALIHSDLGTRHIFITPNEAGRYTITGLIDLEFARFADPLSESQIELFNLVSEDEPNRDAFWHGYGPIAAIPGAHIRSLIYQAIALGWVITDLARLGNREQIPDIALELEARLVALHAST